MTAVDLDRSNAEKSGYGTRSGLGYITAKSPTSPIKHIQMFHCFGINSEPEQIEGRDRDK